MSSKSNLYCSSPYSYQRRATRVVKVGDVALGGNNPVRLQSMTTTDTMNTQATVDQTLRMVQAGCEIVRITAPTVEDARNLGNIKKSLLNKGCNVPLVADIHFVPAAALEAAEHVEKVRINPGNYADSKRFANVEYTDQEYQLELERIEERFTPLVLKMKRLGRAMRIGTNHGSLSDRIMNRYGDSPLGMVESALEFVRICEKNAYYDIVLSMKSSNPKVMIAAYRLLATRMAELGMNYPFHLGVTEAGDGEDGRIKSAIGIGSLLEDGIGDTIRVSLTEDPEFEIPVCQQIAQPFSQRAAQKLSPDIKAIDYVDNAYQYARRKTRAFNVGPFRLAGENLVRVVVDFSVHQDSHSAESLMALLEKQLSNAKSIAPEIVRWRIASLQDLENLKACRAKLDTETSRLAFWGHLENCPELFDQAMPLLDVVSFMYAPGDEAQLRKSKFMHFVASAQQFKLPIVMVSGICHSADKIAKWGDLAPAHNMVAGIEWAESLGAENLILSFDLPNRAQLIYNVRYLAALLRAQNKSYPIHLKVSPVAHNNYDDYRIDAAIALGSLLCEGLGDSVQVGLGQDATKDLELTYNILQAAGVRITKTEYVSCPSCGRTLFDLQSTTERIRSKTGHLKGVKIAIMGCIVNGPGEMADADFGYVGGAPGKINLYVGKECVQKGIDTAVADEKLIELIKEHGKWQDLPTV